MRKTQGVISMFCNLLSAKRLRVGCFDFGDEKYGAERTQLRRLLGAIVYQAMHDGRRLPC
jgi:hypothetical protein